MSGRASGSTLFPYTTLFRSDGAAITMIDRAGTMIPSSPTTVLEPGDHAYVLFARENEAEITLLFGTPDEGDRKSTRLNSSHSQSSYAVFCLKKKTKIGLAEA